MTPLAATVAPALATTSPPPAKPKRRRPPRHPTRARPRPPINRTTKAISPETFVRVWSRASSCAEAAAKLGMTPNAAKCRASIYRRKYEIDLKHMTGGKAKIDREGLKALAKRLRA